MGVTNRSGVATGDLFRKVVAAYCARARMSYNVKGVGRLITAQNVTNVLGAV